MPTESLVEYHVVATRKQQQFREFLFKEGTSVAAAKVRRSTQLQAYIHSVVLIAAILTNLSGAYAAELEGLGAESLALIEEYRANYEKLKDFYSGYSCNGVFSREGSESPSSTLSTIVVTRGEFKYRDHNMYRLSGTHGEDSLLLIATPERYHLFEKSLKTGNYFLRAEGKSLPKAFPDEYWFPSAAFYSGGVLYQVGDEFKVTDVTFRHEQGEDLVEIREEGPLYGTTSHSVFTFYRDRNWATKDYLTWHVTADTVEDFANKRNLVYSWEREELEYDGEVNGIPILKKVVQSRGVAPFGTKDVDHWKDYDPGQLRFTSRLTLDVENFVPGPPPLEEFDPAPIIAQIGGIGRTQTNSFRGLLLWINALFLLFLGVYLLRRRKQTSEPPALPSKVSQVLDSANEV